MRIDLLRHGACEGGRIFRGHYDVPVTGEGWQQMQQGLAQLTPGWDAVITSPLIRCQRFARQLSEQAALPLEVVDDLKETSFGDWEGQSVERIWREQESRALAWARAPDQVGPPGGEPYWNFRQRVLKALTELHERYDNQRLLLVTHGGIIKLLLSLAHNKPPSGMMNLQIGYGFAAELEYAPGEVSVLSPDESVYVYSG